MNISRKSIEIKKIQKFSKPFFYFSILLLTVFARKVARVDHENIPLWSLQFLGSNQTHLKELGSNVIKLVSSWDTIYNEVPFNTMTMECCLTELRGLGRQNSKHNLTLPGQFFLRTKSFDTFYSHLQIVLPF